ncbi:MAG: Ser-Thr-rich GPI-anchored membrane family protein, partial [Ignavibacteriaceae bacterium]
MQRFLQVVFLLMLFTSLLSARSITVTTPNGGEILQAGRSTQLQWISSGVTFVKIQFTTNDGSSWSDVIYKTDASLGSYQWDIPNNPTSQAKIRVIDFDSTAYADTSNATFQIVQLSLTSPILNQKIQTGKSTSIQWSASSNVATVKLEYSTNGGGTWTTITSFLSALPASYNWTPIPNTPSTTALVRISMPSVPAVSDTSANFSITSLALTKPVGGETWFAGSVKAITWTSANIANVKLEYSTDNGFSWGTITSIVSATSGTYSWTLPASFSTNQALVRISDASASSIADQSGSVFTISSLTVLSPNGGEGFAPSSTQTITWSAPYFNMVNVQYSTDNGVSWNTIQNSVNASLGSLSWNLPAISFANGKIRIVATDDSTNYDVSNNSFKVASIAVTAPNGSENLQKGFVKRITWTNSSPVTSVNIDLSTDNGGSWLPIISGASASTGYYDWTVGDYPSSQALIRISDAANPNISDQSDAVFTIKKLDLTSPNGGEYFQAGTVRQITWTSGNIANVKIEYSTDSGSTWSTAISSVSAAAGTYDWTVPSTPTNLAKVRISDAAASSIAATSSSVFNISLLTLVSPNGGENFSVSSGQNIQWTSSSIANVKLEYTTNNGVTWKTIISSTPAALSSYAWTVPNDPTVSAKVRISDVLNSATTDASSAVFTISTLKVTSPNGGEKWAVGSSQTITWQNISSVSNVDISYSIDNGTNWIPIPSATNIAAGLETYTWSIPDTTTSSSLAKIKVSNTPDNTINDVSDLVFTLAKIRVTSPNGGDTLQVGKQYNITWSSSNVSLVNINYSTDNGLNWTTFAPSISASAGTYAWTVPNIPTSQALIKIEDVLSPAVADQSDAAFKIFKLDVVSPNGGEKWAVGNTKTITWNNVSSLASVNIDYSTNNGSTWIPVTTNIAAALQTYDWNIPDTLTPSSSARIKISSFTSPLIYDVSDNVFTFAKIKVTSPNSGDTVQVGKQYNIAWDASNISSVNIKVSTDNGVNWSQITTVAASVGNYLWTVNSNPTQQAFIRIEDVSDTTVFDQSNVAFKIVSLDLTSPNGSESWTIGSTKNITWTSSGIANVKLEYSTNNGVNWTSINSSVVAASGSYAWTIPGSASSQALVRISDAVQPLIKDSSLSTFYIGTLSVTGPGAGTIHQAGKAITVNWTSSGIDNVNIAYTTNNGTSWTILPDVVSSAAVNSFTFTLPANLSSTQARIRVSDASTGQIRDSSGIFTIASLTVTYPNGGNYLQAGKTDSIKWSSSSVTTVRIDYSSDNGSNWNNLVLSYPAVSGIYSWALDANYDSPNFLIKVSDTADPTIVDSSDNTFKIGNITNIDSPLAGDTVLAGSIKPITWVNTSSVTQVKIEYSTDDGFNYNIIESSYPSTITGGTYNWTVPAALTSTTGRIRISDANSNLGIKSISGQFSFLSLTVTSPNGNEIWQTGSTNNITWTASPSIANVKIEYSKDGGQSYTSIIASVSAGLGTYAWTISDTLIVANQMCIRISDVTNSNIKDTSNALFTVAKLKLLTPVASDYLQGGKTKLITWESAYIQNVRIQYSSNGGGSYNDIIASTPAAAGSYSWTIPNTATSSAKIRISSVNTPTIVDSSSLFKVISLQVLTPNGLENLQSGSTTNITWSPDVNIDSVVINYSINNGISWNSIISLANTGSFVWTVPDSITTSGRIKISDKADATINDISDNAFTISSYAISSPQAGYYWQSGTTHAINWNIQNVATVNIYYSVDGGVNWLSVQTNVPTSNGTYNWTVPAIAATNQAMIKISDVLNPTNAITSGQFKISNLAVTTPNGGENYIKGST